MYRRLPMSRLALDRGYETGAVHRGLELLGITGYIPAIQFSNPPEKYGFSYDPQLDAFICPEGVPLTYHRLNCSKSTGKYLGQFLRLETGTLYFKDSKKGHSCSYGRMPPCRHGPKS